ncbi:MAG: NADH-ubiquinone oxidoreductase-F iron-sulfur binding region domain-containing protein [Thiohalomonadaceae bacterium]
MSLLDNHPLTGRFRSDGEAVGLAEYERAGGYEGLRKAVKSLSPEAVTDEVFKANLRGRGGAGFPAGIKWKAVPPHPGSACYVVANADEMEPGAFKDRVLMEGDPHQLIEGMVIAAWALQATAGYIFVRFEYQRAARRLEAALAEAERAGYLGSNVLGSGWSFDLHLHTSAGRYICGESSALLNALEGRRAIPRAKLPRPTTAGLWGHPTMVNNVETFCNVPHIITRGAAWFVSVGVGPPARRGGVDGGTKVYTLSGRVNRPGWYESPMGTPLRTLIEEHGGGMRTGYALRAVQPGGASTGFLAPEHLDMPMDFDSPERFGVRLGTGTVMVHDDHTCPVGALHNMERFFAQESCGWCTPCREGLPWVEKILLAFEEGQARPEDLEALAMHTRLIDLSTTFCAHAPGAMAPLESGLALFRDEFERHLREGRCPYLTGT